jgi:sulfite dehydrogenase (cytochrome) subunit B
MMKPILLSSLLLAAPALADESAIKLQDAAGRDLVERNCVACHSLDYIPMNSPFLDRNGWEGTITKMIKVMGAPITADDVPGIVDYLVRNYGKP